MPAALIIPIVLGTLLNALNSSMIAVALVSIGKDLGVSSSQVIWLVTGLYLTTAVAQPTMGRLAEQFGARRVFFLGLALVIGGAMIATVASRLDWLIVSRVVLGLGTSAAYPAGMVIIKRWTESHAGSGVPTGLLTAVSFASGAAVAAGPPLGGVLVQSFDWRAIFWVNLPLAAVALLLGLRGLPADGPLEPMPFATRLRKLDLVGVALFAAALCALLLFLKEADHGPRWPLLGAAAALAAALAGWELRADWPFIDLRMLRAHPGLVAAYARCVGCYIVFYSFFYSIPAWLEHSKGLGAAAAGVITFPLAATSAASTLAANWTVTRRGVGFATVAGSLTMLVGSGALLFIGAGTPLVGLVFLIGVLGVPNGFNSLANQTQMYRAAPPEQIGSASGLYRTMQYVGGGLSTAFLTVLGDPPTDAGLHRLGLALLALSLVLVITAALALRHKNQSGSEAGLTTTTQKIPEG